MTRQVVRHSWLGTVWRHDEGRLLAQIEIDPAIRPARVSGRTDAEVLITVGPALDGLALDAILTAATDRIRAALDALNGIKAFAVTHAPAEWWQRYEVETGPIEDLLFVEGFSVTSPTEMEISFDFGDLDMLVVRVDEHGRGRDVQVMP